MVCSHGLAVLLGKLCAALDLREQKRHRASGAALGSVLLQGVRKHLFFSHGLAFSPGDCERLLA